jgi:prevent-host-death family protein
MKTFSIHHAKANLLQLIERACQGEDIVISRAEQPLVRLVPFAVRSGRPRPGALRGTLRIPADFFAPLPADELASWE